MQIMEKSEKINKSNLTALAFMDDDVVKLGWSA